MKYFLYLLTPSPVASLRLSGFCQQSPQGLSTWSACRCLVFQVFVRAALDFHVPNFCSGFYYQSGDLKQFFIMLVDSVGEDAGKGNFSLGASCAGVVRCCLKESSKIRLTKLIIQEGSLPRLLLGASCCLEAQGHCQPGGPGSQASYMAPGCPRVNIPK